MASDWTPTASARRWLSTSDDVVATDADGRVALWSADALPLCHPRDWPAAFRSCAPLKALVNKQGLRGTRCRSCAILPPPAAAAAVELRAFHPFSNSEAVAAALGWPVVKGFVVLERADCAVGASFVALKWWWNEDTATGSWVDLTPVPWPDGEQRLLVESPLGEKEEQTLSAAQRDFAIALVRRLCPVAAAPAPAAAPAASSPSPAASPSPCARDAAANAADAAA